MLAPRNKELHKASVYGRVPDSPDWWIVKFQDTSELDKVPMGWVHLQGVQQQPPQQQQLSHRQQQLSFAWGDALAGLLQFDVREKLIGNGWVRIRTQLTPAIAGLNYKDMSKSRNCGSIVQGQVGRGRKFFELKEDAAARMEFIRIASDRLFMVGFIFCDMTHEYKHTNTNTHIHTHTHTHTHTGRGEG